MAKKSPKRPFEYIMMSYPLRNNNVVVYSKICEQIRKNNIILFAGAGVTTGFSIASWSELLREVATEYKGTYQKATQEAMGLISSENSSYDNFLDAAEILKNASSLDAGNDFFKEVVSDVIREGSFRNNNFPTEENAIYWLPHIAKRAITTNFDTVLDRVYKSFYGDKTVNICLPTKEEADQALSKMLHDNESTIFKAHGCISKPKTLIFARSDYESAYEDLEEPNGILPIVNAMRNMVAAKDLLYIGSSLSEACIAVTTKSLTDERRNYAIVSKKSEHETINKSENKPEFTCDRIFYPNGEHGCATTILRQLARDSKKGTRWNLKNAWPNNTGDLEYKIIQELDKFLNFTHTPLFRDKEYSISERSMVLAYARSKIKWMESEKIRNDERSICATCWIDIGIEEPFDDFEPLGNTLYIIDYYPGIEEKAKNLVAKLKSWTEVYARGFSPNIRVRVLLFRVEFPKIKDSQQYDEIINIIRHGTQPGANIYETSLKIIDVINKNELSSNLNNLFTYTSEMLQIDQIQEALKVDQLEESQIKKLIKKPRHEGEE